MTTTTTKHAYTSTHFCFGWALGLPCRFVCVQHDLLPRLPVLWIPSYQCRAATTAQAMSSRPMSAMAWRAECNPGNANRACGNFAQSLLVNQASGDQHRHAVSVARLSMVQTSKDREGKNVRGERCWSLGLWPNSPQRRNWGTFFFSPACPYSSRLGIDVYLVRFGGQERYLSSRHHAVLSTAYSGIIQAAPIICAASASTRKQASRPAGAVTSRTCTP